MEIIKYASASYKNIFVLLLVCFFLYLLLIFINSHELNGVIVLSSVFLKSSICLLLIICIANVTFSLGEDYKNGLPSVMPEELYGIEIAKEEMKKVVSVPKMSNNKLKYSDIYKLKENSEEYVLAALDDLNEKADYEAVAYEDY